MRLISGNIRVRHNIEVAHRLSLLPGKCENIHGHSMWVELDVAGSADHRGLLNGLDFGRVKYEFRSMLDAEFDHRLLLNEADELAKLNLPGTRLCAADPTTENIARWVLEWAIEIFPGAPLRVDVQETHVNSATARMVDFL